MEGKISPDERRLVLKDFNHRINNDLQALLAFIKLQKRFEIDKDEIINSTCVVISSISAIQNLMYNTDDKENLISMEQFCEEFIKTLKDHYPQSGITFSYQVTEDFSINAKKVFHIMFLINELINLSIEYSLKDEDEKEINFTLRKEGEECYLNYSDNGQGIQESVNNSPYRQLLLEQLIKQLDGNQETCDNSDINVRFTYE